MMLTGKCKRPFLKWLKIRVNSILHEIDNIEFWFNLQDESFKITLIIEWFDSVGIYVNAELDYLHLVWFPTINNNWNFEEYEFETRQEAIKEAIKEANEIYNSK
jgi:hypothetical protein